MIWRVACLATVLGFLAVGTLHATGVRTLTGVGASFPAPIYARWADLYYRQTGNRINYQSLGSNAGIQQARIGTVDFAGSDMPLAENDLRQEGMIQFPVLIGGVVPVVNIQGVASGRLQLDGETLAGIYLGRIRNWNDPAIVRLNPEVRLPDAPIMAIRRADGAGATFAFTDYLSRSSPAWRDQIGAGPAVRWSVGAAGKGNEGVAAFVQRLPDSIGYVEYSYALQNHMTMVALRGQTGARIEPEAENFLAALERMQWSPRFVPMTDPAIAGTAADRAWPIMTATFVLVRSRATDPAKTDAVQRFFGWAYTHGDAVARDLGYFPIPARLKARIRASWREAGASDCMRAATAGREPKDI
ncbi:MAG: phosphate ABC transporter substrate-binding protein PstS [Xanthomonadaceae bacterium]|nr:phosphate ABC transporter substrate-binding protein PstS [Xanthomonadaceae bacterium]